MENDIVCSECDGTGEMPDMDALCPICNGWGTVDGNPRNKTHDNFDTDYNVREGDNVSEGKGLQFDKFMDNILVKEGRTTVRQKQEDSPLRRRAALHQDRPANRTVIGPRK